MGETLRLDGRPVAEALEAEAAKLLASIAGRPASLASVHRGDETPFALYLRRQQKAAERLGIVFRSEPLAAPPSAEGLAERVRALDADPTIDAVLVEHPMPAELRFGTAMAGLRPEKDVDGVGPLSLGLLVGHAKVHVPAVARAAIAIARHYGLGPAGRRVAVIGRSETVGLPLALLLLSKSEGGEATVTVAHSQTRDLRTTLRDSELIFSCAGRPGLLDRSNVPRGAAVIDVGLSSVPDPNKTGGRRAVGDADAASLDGWAGALSPVPGGVGPVAVAALMLAVAEARTRALRGGDAR